MYGVLRQAFKFDKNVLIAELRSMRMSNDDIDKYVEDFNKVLNKYPNGRQDAEYVK
jgi:hypothetical protein